MPTVKLIVSHCSNCKASVVPCVSLGIIHLCKGCDTTGNYVKLATYRRK